MQSSSPASSSSSSSWKPSSISFSLTRRDYFRSWYQGPHPILIMVFTWNHFSHFLRWDMYCIVGLQCFDWISMLVSHHFSFVSFSNWQELLLLKTRKIFCSWTSVSFVASWTSACGWHSKHSLKSNPNMLMVSPTTSDALASMTPPASPTMLLPS